MSGEAGEHESACSPDGVAPPEVLPLLALRDAVYFPKVRSALFVGRRRSLQAVEEAWDRHRCVMLVAQRQARVDEPGPDDLFELGVVARVTEREARADRTVRVWVQGLSRARVREYLQTEPYHRVRVEPLPPVEEAGEASQALIDTLVAECRQIAARVPEISAEAVEDAVQANEAGRLADAITPYLGLPVEFQQQLLETQRAGERLEKLAGRLHDEAFWRAGLVQTLSDRGLLRSPACRRAFTRVPRHRFIPTAPLAAAYHADIALPTLTRETEGGEEWLSSISAPNVVAENLGALRLRRGLRVLEIGAGSGYNAALLAEIAGAENVLSVDLDPEVVEMARGQLAAAGYDRVRVEVADGWDGFPAGAPYDRIIGTVGVDDLPPAWWEQLREGGMLVMWLSFRCIQLSLSFRKREGRLLSEKAGLVWSINMRGKQPRQMDHPLGDRLTVIHDSLDAAVLPALDAILDGPAEPLPLPAPVPPGFGWDFCCFLALSHPLAMSIKAARLKALLLGETAHSIVDLERGQMAVVGGEFGSPARCVCFGGMVIGEEMRRLVDQWSALGQPRADRLMLAGYPRTTTPRADPLPPGRWLGRVEKAQSLFQWRYRPDRK
jgi:protein-L-isoaspartate(D-aspartate) O-methyltransferase